MAKLIQIKPKNLARAITKIGFYKHNQAGSHATFKHPDGRRVTIPMHNRNLKKGLLHGILKDIELTTDAFKDLI